ncbi:cell division protein FtsQ/DivIB [uncultured Abyssibacter sp.]|uniref:cell division protein FtsQ/DivIB n=1 Tax=uncultured Abyssibacter sp. TaxID=2320202 RepID=UPI0032B1BB3A
MSVAIDVLRPVRDAAVDAPRRPWFGTLMLALVTALVVFWVLASQSGPLNLEVHGVAASDPQTVRAATIGYLDTGLFKVSPTAIEQSLEALPWVASAQVSRRFPDRLTARVIEHQPVARWGDAALIAADGRIFSPPAESWPAGLPRLDGPAESRQEMLEQWAVLMRTPALGDIGLAALAIDDRGAWTAELSDGVVLRLGRAGIPERMQRFAGPVRRALADRWDEVATIDLRYTNGFAVGWREPAQTAERN